MYLLMTIFSSPTSLLGFYDRIKHTPYWKCAFILSLETKLEQDIVGLDSLHCWTPCWTLSRSPAQQPARQTSQPSFFLPTSLLPPFSLLLPPSSLSLTFSFPSLSPLSLFLSYSFSLSPLLSCLFLKQGLTMYPRLAWNPLSALNLLHAGTVGVCCSACYPLLLIEDTKMRRGLEPAAAHTDTC